MNLSSPSIAMNTLQFALLQQKNVRRYVGCMEPANGGTMCLVMQPRCRKSFRQEGRK